MAESRKRDAELLRVRFQDCKSGLPFARALRDVVVRDTIRRNSADLSPQLRDVLDKIEVGRLTPPEVTSGGVEVFALCEKKETTADTPARRALREEIYSEKFKATCRSLPERIEKRCDDRVSAAISAMLQPAPRLLRFPTSSFGADPRRTGRDRAGYRVARFCLAQGEERSRPSTWSPIRPSWPSAPSASVSISPIVAVEPEDAAATFADALPVTALDMTDHRRARTSGRIERARRDLVDQARGVGRDRRQSRRHRHQPGLQGRALPLGLRRSRPHRISGADRARAYRQRRHAGDDALVRGTQSHPGHDPYSAQGRSRHSSRRR